MSRQNAALNYLMGGEGHLKFPIHERFIKRKNRVEQVVKIPEFRSATRRFRLTQEIMAKERASWMCTSDRVLQSMRSELNDDRKAVGGFDWRNK